MELYAQTSRTEKDAFELAAGWRFGLVFGIALVLFAWGWDTLELALASVELAWAKLILALLIVIPTTVLAAWLAARQHDSALFKWIIWLAWGVLVAVPVGVLAAHLPFEAPTRPD